MYYFKKFLDCTVSLLPLPKKYKIQNTKKKDPILFYYYKNFSPSLKTSSIVYRILLFDNLSCNISPISLHIFNISSRSCFVCAADIQNLALDDIIGVAGYATTTTAKFLFKHSLENALHN